MPYASASAEQERTSQLKNLGGEVLENRRRVDGRLGTDTHVVLGACLQVTVDTTDGELCAGRAWSAGGSTARRAMLAAKTRQDASPIRAIRRDAEAAAAQAHAWTIMHVYSETGEAVPRGGRDAAEVAVRPVTPTRDRAKQSPRPRTTACSAWATGSIDSSIL